LNVTEFLILAFKKTKTARDKNTSGLKGGAMPHQIRVTALDEGGNPFGGDDDDVVFFG
jgi:hypothetical protein